MSPHIYSRVMEFSDGFGMSGQKHAILFGPEPNTDGSCPDEKKLVDTGIVHHWRIHSSPPRGETEEAQNWGPSDLKGVEEQTYEFAGKHYATLERALAAKAGAQS